MSGTVCATCWIQQGVFINEWFHTSVCLERRERVRDVEAAKCHDNVQKHLRCVTHALRTCIRWIGVYCMSNTNKYGANEVGGSTIASPPGWTVPGNIVADRTEGHGVVASRTVDGMKRLCPGMTKLDALRVSTTGHKQELGHISHSHAEHVRDTSRPRDSDVRACYVPYWCTVLIPPWQHSSSSRPSIVEPRLLRLCNINDPLATCAHMTRAPSGYPEPCLLDTLLNVGCVG